MIIGFDAKRYFHNYTGLGNYSRYVIDQLAHQYPSCNLVLYDRNPSKPGRSGVRIGRLDNGFQRVWSMNGKWKNDQLDLYHGLSNELPYNSKRSVTPKVVTIHDLLYLDFPQDYPWIDRSIYNFKFRHSAQNADVIIAISEATKSDLVERFNIRSEKIEVIYQSCSPEFFRTIPKDVIRSIQSEKGLTKPYIVCIGSFSHRKNQAQLLNAFQGSRAKGALDLVFVGPENVLSTKLRAQFPDQEIHFLHGMSNDQLQAILQGALFSVYPSLKEGFGIPVLESLAAGVPCLVAEETSCQEAGGEAVVSFEPGKKGSLIAGIDQLFTSSSLRTDLKEKAEVQLQKFAPEKEIPRLYNLYQKLSHK